MAGADRQAVIRAQGGVVDGTGGYSGRRIGKGAGSGYTVTTSALVSRQRGLPSLSAGGGIFSDRRIASSRF